MGYVSLYRKYRSQSFAELLGQEHITAVLRNSIAQKRIAHAYLFCGPRGCGKTSTARLLAKALNCTAADEPTPDPCGECSMCLAIRDGQAMDVVEMDAASETGIDDVREKIIENAHYAPVQARYKVYIIDEVHDLSQKAFDSLLKTIEEPPAHVVFVLATTEAHKVPVTIRSRCQRMDFRRGSLADLHANLERVAQAEGVEYDAEALFLIARAAEGSFRDSLSLLEQVLAVGGTRITADTVRTAIGAVTADMLDAVVTAVHAKDMRGVLDAAAQLIASGTDVRQAVIALQEHLRDLLVLTYTGSAEALGGVPAERVEIMQEQSRWFRPQQMLAMLGVLAEAERDLRYTNQHRLVMERALWRLVVATDRAASVEAPRTVADRAPTASTPVSSSRPTVPPVSQAEHPDESVVQAEGRDDVTLEILQRIWPRVRQRVIQRAPSAATVLTDNVVVAELSGKTMTLQFPSAFLRDRADRPASREIIEKALQEILGIGGYRVRCALKPTESRQDATLASSSGSSVRPAVLPLLEEVARVLDGEVVDTKGIEEES